MYIKDSEPHRCCTIYYMKSIMYYYIIQLLHKCKYMHAYILPESLIILVNLDFKSDIINIMSYFTL